MKLRILNYRVIATHGLISTLGYIPEPVSVSDFHAFVYDPAALNTPAYRRRTFSGGRRRFVT